jgi:hypothetical protein
VRGYIRRAHLTGTLGSVSTSASGKQAREQQPAQPPSVLIGVAAGVTALLCCVGPTVLAMLGVVSAGTAYVWANELYDGYAWLFRGAGLLLLAALVGWSLRRRDQCSLAGGRRVWRRLALALAIAVATYAGLYALTTWLGTFA